jgi:serine/threonine protein kinase
VAAPKRIGQYELRREIGEGGMGVVYEALHPQLEKRVAIKVLHRWLVEDEALVARFIDEGRAAARIRHPHVVDITDVGSIDGVPYLVMELLEGESLGEKIARDAPLPEHALVDLLLPGARRSKLPTRWACCIATSSPRTSSSRRSAGSRCIRRSSTSGSRRCTTIGGASIEPINRR